VAIRNHDRVGKAPDPLKEGSSLFVAPEFRNTYGRE
jgi:hypothetical protein